MEEEEEEGGPSFPRRSPVSPDNSVCIMYMYMYHVIFDESLLVQFGAWYTCVGTGLVHVSNSGAWYVCRDGACTCQQ